MECSVSLPQQAVVGIVLAGGKSTRFGSDKALYSYRGHPMITYALGFLKTITDNIFISSANPAHSQFGYPLIADQYMGIGPIGGIHAALYQAGSCPCFFVPVDLPLLTSDIATSLVSAYRPDNMALVARYELKPQPLVGIYNRLSLPLIEKQISRGDYKITQLLNQLNARFLDFNPTTSGLNPFENVNTKMEMY